MVVGRVTTITKGPPGPPGPAGPPGPIGSPMSQEVFVTTPAATWTIAHSLPRNPDVTVIVGGEEWEAEVHYSTGQVVIIFATPQSGSAVLS